MFYVQPVTEPVIQESPAEPQVTPERDAAAQFGELQIRNIMKHVHDQFSMTDCLKVPN